LILRRPPSLEWMGPGFAACAVQVGGLNVIVDEVTPDNTSITGVNFTMIWGQPADAESLAYPITNEELVFVVHPDNPQSSLTAEQLHGLYAGRIQRWEDLDPTGSFAGAVSLLAYQPGDDIQQKVETIPGFHVAALQTILLAPSPSAVVSEVASNSLALGYIPRRSLDATVKGISILDGGLELTNQPVLALAGQEPAGKAKQWLACLQNTWPEN